jgi:hypothetical protein
MNDLLLNSETITNDLLLSYLVQIVIVTIINEIFSYVVNYYS